MLALLSTLDLLFFGITIGFIGKVLLGITVIRVHAHIVHERHIDKKVITAMRKEKVFALAGVLFMIIGYLLEIMHYEYIVF